MARRRSLNRRRSRKSMNITELDQDSEVIDTHDPMWWKNIEGEITVRQSRRSSYANTTDPILNNDSTVDSSELPDEWWNKLDRTDGDSSRRVSTRRSVKQQDTPRETFDSDETEDISIKKRKVLLRAGSKKSVGTEVFLAALEDPNDAEKLDSGRKRKSKNETDDARKIVRKRNRQSGTNSNREDPEGSSLDTSTETDIIVKSRPKSFKKRSAKLPDDLFDDILITENLGTPEIARNKEIPSVRNSPSAKDLTNVGTLGAKESSVQPDEAAGTPVKFSDLEDPGLMGPPKSASLRKRLSSISRNLDLSSDESGNETGVRKTRLGFAKKARATTSINPFDELIGVNLSEAKNEIEKRKNVNSSIDRLERRNGNANQRSTRSGVYADEIVNSETRRESSGIASAARGESLAVENLPFIEETSDRGDENEADRLFVSRSTPKILEVSLTRISSSKQTHVNEESDLEENSQDERDEERNARIKSLRSSGRSHLIDDAAYELPAKDRSDTPLFSGSENENEKSVVEDRSVGASSRAYSLSKHESTTKPRESLDPAIASEALPITSRKSQGRANYSRTRIFSDEDISLEDLEEINRRNEVLMRSLSDEERAKLSGKSVKTANKSRRNVRPEDSTDEDGKEAEEAPANSENSHWKEKTRRSRKSVANKSRRIEDEMEDTEKRGRGSTSSRTGTRTRGSRSSVVANKSRQSFLFDDDNSEDEPPGAGKTDPEAENFRSMGKPDTFGKSSATNKSRRIIQFDESVGEDKTNDADKTDPRMSNSRLKSRQSIMSDETTSEDEPEIARKVDSQAENSRFSEKSDVSGKILATNKSRRIPQFDGSIGEWVEENVEKTDEESRNSRLKRKSRESVAPNKSQQLIISDETDSEDESEDAEGTRADSNNSRTKEEPQGSRKSLASANKSRLKIHSDESMSETETGDAAKTSPSLTKPRRSGKSIIPETTRQSVHRLMEKIDEFENAGKSIETSRRRNLRISDKIDESRGLSVEKHLESAKIVDANNEEDGIVPSIGKEVINVTMHKESLITSTRRNANDLSTLVPGNPNGPSLAANLSNDKNLTSHIVDDSKNSRKQKSITDFFPSRFLQRSSNTSVREAVSSFDRDKLELVKAKMEEMKKQELEAMKLDVEMNKKKETNPSKASLSHLRTKRDVRAKENATSKNSKVVDKAYIVNGTVYKRPKLPRPKAWVTDRLYRHLWKRMEPKYHLATRVKSEQFIQQLSEIVALTIRRKKYESYKIEVDALMKEMARLGIVKTRNDFYDFCYDFLPYDFRVKVTPILLPGNVRNIPYDPEKLHAPILRET